MKKSIFAFLTLGSLAVSATITGGVPLSVAEGTTETVAAGTTVDIPYFYNAGTLTVGAGATLNVKGAANTSFGAVGEGKTCTLNLEENANLVISSASNATFASTAFVAAYLGATGIVNIASGATLDITRHCRFACNNASNEQRLKKTFVELNISGTLRTVDVETTPFFPTTSEIAASTNNYSHAFVANLNPGGLWSTRLIQPQDCAFSRINFNGGTLQYTDWNWLPLHGYAVVECYASAGNSIIIDTAMTMPIQNGRSWQFHGPGGLIKRGTGTLLLYSEAQYSDFSGPIRVEQGTLLLSRPLLPGQTVTVASGAKFIPCSSVDYAFVTYENPADQPAATTLFTVNGRTTGGVDLLGLAPAYDTDRLGGPTLGTTASLDGTVTHDAATVADPFTLVGQHKDGKLILSNTGLDAGPLLVQGPGTFEFTGPRTFCVDNGVLTSGDHVLTLAQDGIYRRNGVLTLLDPDDTGYTLADGSLGGTNVFIGVNGTNANLTVAASGSLFASGKLYLGSNLTANDRAQRGTSCLVVNGVVDAKEIRFGAYSTTNGVPQTDIRAQITVNAGGSVRGGLFVNDDCHGQLVLNGGLYTGTLGFGTGGLFGHGQSGSRLDVEITAAGGTVNFANITNRLAFNSTTTLAGLRPVRFTGDGSLTVTGAVGVLTWGDAGWFTADWCGDTFFRGGIVKLNGGAFPSGSGKGAVRVAGGTFDFNGSTMAVNEFVHEGGTLTNSSVKTASVTVGVDGRDITNTIVYPPRMALTKAGAGTMTTFTTLPESFTLAGGTFAIRASTYAHYRFKIEKACGAKCNSMQISEFKLLRDGVDVTRPYARVSRASTGKASPGNESPEKAVDGSLDTKFLDFNADATNVFRDACWLQLDYAAPVTITHYTWATANDCGLPDDPLCRNPKNWRLQGSVDGTTWVDLDNQKDFVTSVGIKKWCGTTFIADGGGTSLRNSSVLVQSGTTLDVQGGTAAVGSLITIPGGTVRLHDATLQLNGSGILSGGGIIGTGTIEKTGAGTFSFGGANAFTGDVKVCNGTLKVDTAAKWFRLTIKQTGPADKVMQCSEFGLFDADGNRLNLGLTAAANGTDGARLQPGTFAKAAAYSCGGVGGYEDADKLFDGNTATKWCATQNDMSASLNDSSKWRIVTMRLADNAAPVASCNFCTANDLPNRSPRNWMIEASFDGSSWFTVGEYSFTPTTAYLTWYNSGTPFAFTTPAGSIDSPFPGGTPVEVLAGATLDCGNLANAVSALRYDASVGGGTITNFAPAATGTLYITNAPGNMARQLLDLTAVGAVANPENLKNWSVVVDGRLRGGCVGIDPATGKLFLKSSGVIIYIR